MSLRDLFGGDCAVIGMIHVDPLPGTPGDRGDWPLALRRAAGEARLYREAGVQALLVENMHDLPYLKGAVGPEITAAMALLTQAVKEESGLPTGVQILAGANREALAVAKAAGLEFIRAEGFAFAHVADEGLMEACAGPLLRYRRQIGAEHVAVLADVKKKHASHAITADLSVGATARAAAFFGADAVVVTGTATGEVADPEILDEVRRATEVPVFVGSGVTVANVHRYLSADALIVGSHFKVDGHWRNPVDPARVERFVDEVARLRAAGPR